VGDLGATRGDGMIAGGGARAEGSAHREEGVGEEFIALLKIEMLYSPSIYFLVVSNFPFS
jgi:hypothetical protein